MGKRLAFALELSVLLLILGCSTTRVTSTEPTTTQYGTSSEASTEEPADETGFTLESENVAAEGAIVDAKRIFDANQQAAGRFARLSVLRCEDAEMERAVIKLQDIETTANRYVELALARTSQRDREAALDVADELTTLALDGYLDAAGAYRTKKCYDRAKFYLQELVRIYTGDSYAQWRDTAKTQIGEIAALEAQERKAKQPSTKKKSRQ